MIEINTLVIEARVRGESDTLSVEKLEKMVESLLAKSTQNRERIAQRVIELLEEKEDRI